MMKSLPIWERMYVYISWEILNYCTNCKNVKAFWFYTLYLPCFAFLQEEITEDDIDDSFKAMFAQLAGEVGFEKIPLTG